MSQRDIELAIKTERMLSMTINQKPLNEGDDDNKDVTEIPQQNVTNQKKSDYLTSDGDIGASSTSSVLTRKAKKKIKVSNLIKESTNKWLYTNDMEHLDGETECINTECINNFIAITVIFIQITAYVAITYFLVQSVTDSQKARRDSCFGPNCNQQDTPCMVLTTGALVSVMLVGFLWADVINVIGICKYNWWASIICLIELFTAIICGFLIGIYTDTDFDAISGAIGILFVHDLDERVYASMEIISRSKKTAMCKKLLAVILWIFVSLGLSLSMACKFQGGSYIPTSFNPCLDTEYQCRDSNCIWNGFVCNGVEDCFDGSDEGNWAYCDYSLINCPEEHFMCLSTGSCLAKDKVCDGVLDCEDGSDESRERDCAAQVSKKECPNHLNISQFKCNNGQCIDAKYSCDGIKGDCIDGSDEYPFFDGSTMTDTILECPYETLIECGVYDVLCKIDGKCISKRELCDGVEQCSDGADEKGCEYQCDPYDIADGYTFQCGGSIANINITHIVLFDETTIEFNDLYSLINDLTINETATEYGNYSYDLVRYSLVYYLTINDTGKCIPNEWRCDGLQDCDDGSDEQLCTLLPCKDDEYRCASTGECIPKTWLCDFNYDCKDGSDEDAQVCDDEGVSMNRLSCDDSNYTVGTINEGGQLNSYYFQLPNDGSVSSITFSTCTNYTRNSSFDSIIYLYGMDDESNLNLIKYNDDARNCRTDWYASRIVYNNSDPSWSPGNDYIVTVGHYSSDKTGRYGISIDCN